MNALATLAKDIFWAAATVLFLLIVAFGALRLVGRFGAGTFVAKGSNSISHLATPAG